MTDTREVPELLPCPFCGGAAEIERIGDHRKSCIINCVDCGCRHESGDFGKYQGWSWNRRTAAPVVDDIEPKQEQCFYCKEWYLHPIQHHHDHDECVANVAASKVDDIERLIRELRERQPHTDPSMCALIMEQAASALSRQPTQADAEPVAWPDEPTEEMLDALASALTGDDAGMLPSQKKYYTAAYKAMRAAAPAQPDAHAEPVAGTPLCDELERKNMAFPAWVDLAKKLERKLNAQPDALRSALEGSITIGHGSIDLKCNPKTIQRFVDRQIALEIERFKTPLANLVNKLDALHEPLTDITSFASVHGYKWTAGNYLDELEAARGALNAARVAGGSEK